ncbi:MAG: hypothetical protein AAB261_09850 [Chloroflexota bacterium]
MMKRITLLLTLLGLLVTACGPSAEVQATVNAQSNQVATVNAQIATVKAQPPQQVTVQVPVPMTVQVPVTVQVTVQVQATPAAQPTTASTQGGAATAAKPTTAPATAAPQAQDPLAGANPNPVFRETFLASIAKYWFETETSTGKTKIENEAFTIIAKEVDNITWTFGGQKFGNTYTTVVTRIPDGKCKAFDNYGLIFRYKNNANFYLFGISCDGTYRLLRRVEGVFETLVDFTKSNSINPLGQRNILGVRAAGDNLSLYVNDKFLTTVTDKQFADGAIGLYAASRLTPNMTVTFDDVEVYEIK